MHVSQAARVEVSWTSYCLAACMNASPVVRGQVPSIDALAWRVALISNAVPIDRPKTLLRYTQRTQGSTRATGFGPDCPYILKIHDESSNSRKPFCLSPLETEALPVGMSISSLTIRFLFQGLAPRPDPSGGGSTHPVAQMIACVTPSAPSAPSHSRIWNYPVLRSTQDLSQTKEKLVVHCLSNTGMTCAFFVGETSETSSLMYGATPRP